MKGRKAYNEGSRERSVVASCQGMLPPLELKEVRTSFPVEALEEMSHADTFFFFFKPLRKHFGLLTFRTVREYICVDLS